MNIEDSDETGCLLSRETTKKRLFQHIKLWPEDCVNYCGKDIFVNTEVDTKSLGKGSRGTLHGKGYLDGTLKVELLRNYTLETLNLGPVC